MTMRNDRIASDAVAVTPSDTDFVDFVGLYVGGTGNVTVCGEGGTPVTFTACPVGFRLDMRIIQVMDTDTTATLLVGFKA